MQNIGDNYHSLYDKDISNKPFYLMSLKQVDDKKRFVSFFSIWHDYLDEKFETRKISTVRPDLALKAFKEVNQPLAIINDGIELNLFLTVGGHALIEKEMMEIHLPEMLNSFVVARSYAKGFIDYTTLVPKQRFAKGNTRMEIFNRDKFRCRICGVSEDDDIHVRLEVHHIKPWEEGGFSEIDNLILLCKVCHDGINEVNRRVLYTKIGVKFPNQNHLLYFNYGSVGFNNIVSNSVTVKISQSFKI